MGMVLVSVICLYDNNRILDNNLLLSWSNFLM